MKITKFHNKDLSLMLFLYFCIKASSSIASLLDKGEESPDNTGHCTFERKDIREGMVTKKKITDSTCRVKGEKVR